MSGTTVILGSKYPKLHHALTLPKTDLAPADDPSPLKNSSFHLSRIRRSYDDDILNKAPVVFVTHIKGQRETDKKKTFPCIFLSYLFTEKYNNISSHALLSN